MNLTEPQAGSDLGALRTRAVPEGDHFRITGQKIFITYGEHDLDGQHRPSRAGAAARRAGRAAAASRSSWCRNSWSTPTAASARATICAASASSTSSASMRARPASCPSATTAAPSAGSSAKPISGLDAMFTMMNRARLDVGLAGRGARRARLSAGARLCADARPGPPGRRATEGALPILASSRRAAHAAVDARGDRGGARARLLHGGRDRPRAPRSRSRPRAPRRQRRVDLLIPVVKAWSTELGLEAASTNIQVHGGMGFIEETGAAQHLRDARIALIYEGTNGIQAQRPRRPQARARPGRGGARTGRRDARLRARSRESDGASALIAAPFGRGIGGARSRERAHSSTRMTTMPARALAGIGALSAARRPRRRRLAHGAQRARGRAAPCSTAIGDPRFAKAKIATARFYAEHMLAAAPALLPAIRRRHGDGLRRRSALIRTSTGTLCNTRIRSSRARSRGRGRRRAAGGNCR